MVTFFGVQSRGGGEPGGGTRGLGEGGGARQLFCRTCIVLCAQRFRTVAGFVGVPAQEVEEGGCQI